MDRLIVVVVDGYFAMVDRAVVDRSVDGAAVERSEVVLGLLPEH